MMYRVGNDYYTFEVTGSNFSNSYVNPTSLSPVEGAYFTADSLFHASVHAKELYFDLPTTQWLSQSFIMAGSQAGNQPVSVAPVPEPSPGIDLTYPIDYTSARTLTAAELAERAAYTAAVVQRVRNFHTQFNTASGTVGVAGFSTTTNSITNQQGAYVSPFSSSERFRADVRPAGRREEEEELPRKKQVDDERYSELWEKYYNAQAFSLPVSEIWGKTGYQKTVSDDIIGIEFENEVYFSMNEVFTHKAFSLSTDNSLRNTGIEFVLKKPAPIPVVKEQYKELLEGFGAQNPNNSDRASTHVHFDVTKMNYTQIILFSSCYFFVEELLSEFAGESRKNNLFCLRLVDSKKTAYLIKQDMQNEHPYRSKIFHDNLRYSALNLSAVKKFGSMEFRLFPAVSVPDNLDVWIDSLNNIRLYSLKFNTLSALKKELVDVPVEKVIQDMLGDDCLQYILKKIRRKLSDNELLGWSRGAFCNICTILDTEIKIPSEKELKKLFDAAEADDVKIKAKLKLNPVKAPVQRNTYAVISHNFNYDDNDQLDQADLRIETNSGAVADE